MKNDLTEEKSGQTASRLAQNAENVPAIDRTRTHATGLQKTLGHLAMLLFAALISASFSFGAMAAPLIDPAALNAIRFTIAVLVLSFIWFVVMKGKWTNPVDPWRFVILGGLMATYFVLMFVALQTANPVSTGAVFTLIPLMSAGFGWLFMRQTTRSVVLVSLVIAAIGAVWVIFGGSMEAILAFRVGTGEMIFFVGCVCHAAYAPLLRKFDRGEPLLFYALLSTSAICAWILVAGAPALIATDFTSIPLFVWVVIAYLATFTSAGTLFLMQYASLRLPASKVLAYGYLIPGFVILYEGLIGHGWVSLTVLAGALLTAIALVVMAFAPDQ